MSVTITQQERFECSREGCEVTTPKQNLAEGSFCSQQCANLVTGEKLLEHIRNDHRFCHACFRQLKEIERPPASKTIVIGPVDHDHVADTFRNCLVGFEYLTKHAELGERSGHDHVDAGDAHRPSPSDTVVGGVVCTCGTTDPRDDYLRRDEVVSIPKAAHRLCEILAVLGQEGQHDKTIDAEYLLATLEAQDEGRDGAEEEEEDEDEEEDATLDWELALGRAIQD